MRRTPFGGGHRAAMRLETEDARFPGAVDVVCFDRSGCIASVAGDFGQGAVWEVSGRVRTNTYNDTPQLILQDDALFALDKTDAAWRACKVGAARKLLGGRFDSGAVRV